MLFSDEIAFPCEMTIFLITPYSLFKGFTMELNEQFSVI